MEGQWISTIKTIASSTTEVISGINDWVGFFQWLRPGSNKEESMQWHEELWKLRTTLPVMQVLIDKAEWSLYKEGVPELLKELKDVSYDTEDIIEEFDYLKLKSKVEDGAESFDFSQTNILCSFKKVKILQQRADFLMGRMNTLVWQNSTPHFDRSVRPETGSLSESKIYGRHKEAEALKALLGVQVSGSKRKREKASLDDLGNEVLSVLAIVGIGGVGKTTLAQQIVNDELVKAQFDQQFWLCVSDEFDVKRLTTELLHSCGEGTVSNNLNSLQSQLAKALRSKRFLLILDDVWEDAVKVNGQEWQRFCAALTSGVKGSMVLVTTRSSKVAKVVCTIDPFHLDGLEDAAFWEFFKKCALDRKGCTYDSNLESIGRKIVPKLKGSPLAAKTIGRLLRMKHGIDHWNNVLKSELWELKQEKGDILPALRLSYVYLPPCLKRCLSLCAMFPKDYKFEEKTLVDIWLAQSLVEPQGEFPLSTVGSWYFTELTNRCFFQKVCVKAAVQGRTEKYLMHDLIHDMIQLVSRDECFVIRNRTDLMHVPENVRHLSLFTKLDRENLMDLSRCKKLRSIISSEQIGKTTFFPALACWSNELKYLRFLSCCFATLNVLPESIANFNLLRCLKLEIPRNCTFNTFPDSFCSLYNLQIFEARNCDFKKFPRELRQLNNLQYFRAKTFCYERHYTEIFERHRGFTDISVLKHFNLQGWLYLRLESVTGADAAQIELSKREHVHRLTLDFHLNHLGIKDQELLEALRPHQDIKYLELKCFRDDTIAWVSSNSDTWRFSSLTKLHIYRFPKVSSVELILQPASLPSIQVLLIEECEELLSVPAQTFGDFACLEELTLRKCQKIQWIGLVLPQSLMTLHLEDCGDMSSCIPNSFFNLENLINMSLISLKSISFIPAALWTQNLLKLELLQISGCPDLMSIGGSEEVAHIENIIVKSCPKLKGFRQPLQRGRLPF